MTKFRAAEWILSQVLPPERAASIVGDWMEDTSERGDAWFWSCVFRTAIAGLWRDIADNPLAAVRICSLEFGRSVLVPVGISLVLRAIAASHEWPIEDTLSVLTVFWYTYTGPLIPRQSTDRALTRGFVVGLVGWALVFAWISDLPAVMVHDIRTNIFQLYASYDLISLVLALRKRRHRPTRSIAQ